MALQADGGVAGYAPAAAVTKTIDRYRANGFSGQPVTDVTLQKIGVSDSLIPRTLATLKLLDLIDSDGKPTDQFDVLKNATTTDFKARLAEWLKDTYAPIFGFCDPTTATPADVEDAFRGYTPEGQRSRMANLFLGLLEYAGIIEVAPPKPRGRHAPKTSSGPKVTAQGKRAVERILADKGGMKIADLSPSPIVDSHRQRYLDLLIAKAEEQDNPDAELLDRIERALGISPADKGASS